MTTTSSTTRRPTSSTSYDDDLGEDHRGDNPGYDLDEQEAIEELEADEEE